MTFGDLDDKSGFSVIEVPLEVGIGDLEYE